MQEVEIKKAFEKFKPESCVFVLSIDERGFPNGMVAGWNMKCSFDPPMLAVAIGKGRNTKKLIDQSREFVIAVPNLDMVQAVNYFGNNSGEKINKFKQTGIKTMPSQRINTPLLKDATINYECSLDAVYPAGDHDIYLGRVLKAYMNENKTILFNLFKKNEVRHFGEFKHKGI